MLKPILILVLPLVLSVACTGKQGRDDSPTVADGSGVVTIDIDRAKEEKALLYSSVLEKPDVIVLETKPECIIQNIFSVELYEDRIYILDDEVKALYVFHRDGTFLDRVGHRGHGHGEYRDLSDFSIDREKGIIYLWDNAMDATLKYDLHTHDYLSSIKTQHDGYLSLCLQQAGDKLYVNRTAMDLTDPDNYLLREIDVQTGVQTDSCLKAADYNKGWNRNFGFQFGFFYAKNTRSPKFIEMFSDTVVAVTPDGLRPAYAIKSKDFVTDEVIADVRKDCGPNPDGLVDLSRLREGGWIHFVSRWVEWDGMVSFQYHKGDERHYALHDLRTRETRVSTAFSDDYLCEDNNLPLDMCYADEGGVLSVLHAYAIPYFLEHIVAKGRLKPDVDEREKLMRLTDGANPVLFYHACPKRPS